MYNILFYLIMFVIGFNTGRLLNYRVHNKHE